MALTDNFKSTSRTFRLTAWIKLSPLLAGTVLLTNASGLGFDSCRPWKLRHGVNHESVHKCNASCCYWVVLKPFSAVSYDALDKRAEDANVCVSVAFVTAARLCDQRLVPSVSLTPRLTRGHEMAHVQAAVGWLHGLGTAGWGIKCVEINRRLPL